MLVEGTRWDGGFYTPHKAFPFCPDPFLLAAKGAIFLRRRGGRQAQPRAPLPTPKNKHDHSPPASGRAPRSQIPRSNEALEEAPRATVTADTAIVSHPQITDSQLPRSEVALHAALELAGRDRNPPSWSTAPDSG